MEIDKSTEKSLSVFFAIFGVFILIIILHEYYYGFDDRVRNFLDEEYHLKVDSVYINKEEHNFTYVAFSNGKKTSAYFNFKKNDSLSKKKGDSIEYIYRNGEIIKNNLLDLLKANKK